jgi:hypothetical protein
MSKKFFNSLPTFNSTAIGVDRENDVLKNTCIANYGENKNGTFFDDAFLQNIVEQGNNPKGIKSRFGHPNMCSTAFGSYIGRYRNFSKQEIDSKKSVFADLYLDPITKKTQVEGKGITMYEYIMSMAETNPDMFGNSIHIFADNFEKEIDGKMQTLHKLEKLKACDLVDDPAATDELFSADGDLGAVVTQFLDENPSIFETISKDPNIIEDFFERYINYSNRKSLNTFNMSNFFERMKKKATAKKDDDKKFDIDVTLADGSIVKVITEAEQPQVDDKVVDETGAHVKDDTHLLPDGSSITTVGGVITEMADAPTSNETEPTLTEVMNSITKLGNQFSTLQKEQKVNQGLNEKAFELLQDNFQAFEKKTNLALKTVSSSYEAPGAENPKGGKKDPNKVYDADAVAEARKNLKK